MPDALPFVTLHEDEFEDLCCDVFEKEPNISEAQRFGVRGQRQDGIDIKASRYDGGTEVAQCKCYAVFKKADLVAAVTAFRKANNVWKGWDVRRFVVCVACSVRDRRIQDEYQKCREQFQRDGIVFELWGDTSLAQKIRHDRPLVEKYFAGEKLRTLCGSAFAVGSQLSPLDAARTQLNFAEECSAEFEGEAEEELSSIRELARSGFQQTASQKVQRLRGSPRWSLLRARTRAQLLRLAASLKLDCDRDVDGAEIDIREARSVDGRLNYQIVDAAIALHRAGAREALEVLGEPREVDAFNIQLALLDLLGEHEKILELVAKPPFEPNAGTYRLASIAAIPVRDIESAERFAAEAVKQSPDWYLVRSQHAKVKYLQCILPEFPLWHQLAWPLPPPTEYIRTDPVSIERFSEAESDFNDFLSEIELDKDDRRAIETWRLACLSCNPARRAEASSYAAQLLNGDEDHLPAAIWAMHRGLDCDLRSFFDALRRSGKRSTFAAGDVQPLIVLLADEQKFEEAIKLLEDTRERFEQQKVLFIWRFLRAQLAAVQGDDATSAAIAAQEPDTDHRRRLEAAVLRIRANRTGDFMPVGDFLERAYEESDDASYLFDACEAWLRAAAPDRIVPYSEPLLKAFPTASTVRLLVQATFDAGEFEVCSRLLRERRPLFPDGQLPPVLRRVEVECLRQLGELKPAAELAESLASQSSDVETLLTLFQTQLSIGDLRSAATTARQFLTRPEIAPGGLLHVARAIQPEDAALAIKLWDEAVRRGVEAPPDLAIAVNLAFRFGIEERAEDLMPKFYALSQQEGAPVAAYELDDIRRLMAETQQARVDVMKLLGQGAVPLHLVAAQIHTPLAALLSLQGWVNGNSRQPLIDPPLLIRAGSKPSSNIVRSNQRLFVDTTSLIVADFLEILDVVEKEFAPLFVSAHLQEFLHEEIENALPHQPARDAPRQKILSLVDEKRIASCSVSDLSRKFGLPVGDLTRVLIRYAKEEKAVVCDFAVPNGRSETSLAADEQPFLVSCRELAEAMLRAGIVSKAEFDHAAARLARSSSSRADFAIQDKQKVILDFGVAEHLLTTGLLDPLLANVDVTMPAEDIRSLRAELEASGLRLRTVEQLKRIQDRLHFGLREGIYRPVRSERLPDDARPIHRASERCLWDLLAAEGSAATLVWTDDRFLSRHTTVGKLQSVGVVDILRSLHKRGRLTADEFYSKLLQLREANARYLPISRDEVLYHLNRAAVVKNAVTETPALTSLRRYISACCLDKERMQRPFNLNGKQFLGEFLWVLEAVRSVSEAIAHLWEAEGEDERIAEIRADWLLQNLFIPYGAIFDTHGVSLQDDGLETYAVTIGLLLSAGFQLPSPWSKDADAKSSARKKFYRWIESRFLSRLRVVAPAMLERIAAIEAKTLTGLVTGSLRERRQADAAIRLIVGKVVVDLPPTLQRALPMTRHFRQMLRLTEPREMMEIDKHPFAAAHVLDAMVSASAGREAACTAEDNSVTLRFTRGDASLPKDTLLVRGGELPQNATIREPRLPALIGSRSERAAFLRSKKSWFDVGEERLNASVKRILRRKTSIAVFEAIDDARDASAEQFYRSVAKRLRNHETVKVEDTVPTKIESLVDHLRLREEGFAYGNATFEACADRLIREVGVGDAFERFATLPVLLPRPFSDALTSLPPDKFSRFLEILRARLHNPISKIHLFGVLVEASQRTPALITDAIALRDEILDPKVGRENWKSFAQLLHWAHRVFLVRADARQFDPAVRLTVTWLHAGRLHNALIGHGVEHEKLRIAYGNVANAEGPDLAAYEKDLWFDAAHPRHVTRLPCLLRGLGSCLGSISPDLASQCKLADVPWKKQPASAAFLFRDTSLQQNALNSWLGGDSRIPLTGILNEAALAKAQPLVPGEVVEQALRELESGSDELKRWHILRLLIGDLPLAEPSGSTLEQIIARTDFTALVRDQSLQAHTILSFACSRAAAGLSRATSEALENHVFALIEHYREQNSSEEELRTRAAIAVECLANLAMHLSNERDLYARYHELFTKAIWAWPKIAALVGDQFSAWPPIRPLTRERGIWTLELTVRGLGDFRRSPRIPIRHR